MLMDVDDWTDPTRHFVHLKHGEKAKDRTMPLSAILADAINLGLTKMAESCPGTSTTSCLGCMPGTSATRPARLSWPS
jgi:Tn3 transposase DDE domain